MQTAQSALDTAQAKLEAAEAQQAQLRNPSPADVAAVVKDMETAQNNQRAARARLDLLLAGGTPEDQAAADAAIESARGKLGEARAKRNGLAVPAPADVAAARAAVDRPPASHQCPAEARLGSGRKVRGRSAGGDDRCGTGAEQCLHHRLPYRDEEIRAQRELVSQARANLVLKSQPYLPQDIAQARAGVDQARGAYDVAREQANEAIVYAPIDAAVSAKQLDEGAVASPTTTIVTLVTNAVETWVNLEEADLRIAHVGSSATLTTTALSWRDVRRASDDDCPCGRPDEPNLPGQPFPSNPNGAADGTFAPGRSAASSGPTRCASPSARSSADSGRTYAFVVVDGKAQRRRSCSSASPMADYREVVQGLSAGEQLVVTGKPA